MFTGASALAWALALPADGEVHTMDVSDDAYIKYGKQYFERDANVTKKIHQHIRPALETLGGLNKKF
jgi:predicted O-methyltransferase YrrM